MTSTGSGRRCAVLGSPIAHSLSPVLHRTAYAALGLDWAYEAVEVTEDALPGFLDDLDGSWRGLSLTMPLKRGVLPLLDDLSPWAELSRVANTVLFEDGRRTGDNTDVPGAVAAIRERYDGPLRSAVVLGGGATATSMILALAELGVQQVELLVRDPARAARALAAVARHATAPQVRVSPLRGPALEADILVSTVPASAQPPPLVARLAAVPVIFDVVYDPWPTPLASGRGAGQQVVVTGLDLLVHQAALQIELMTGLPVDHALLDALRAAGEQALSAR